MLAQIGDFLVEFIRQLVDLKEGSKRIEEFLLKTQVDVFQELIDSRLIVLTCIGLLLEHNHNLRLGDRVISIDVVVTVSTING